MASFLTPEEPADTPSAFSANTRRNRLRIARACDQCSEARTRCNGATPCGRCSDLQLRCRYDREVKKRGRRSNASKGIQRHALMRDSTRSETHRLETESEKRDNSGKETEIHHHTPVSHPVELRPAPAPVRRDDLLRSPEHADKNPLFNVPDIPAGPRHTPLGNSLTHMTLCRYSCLEPLLPALKGIIPAEEACDLLDIYFAEPGNSLFSIDSPYVLTPVLRKKSLLSQTNSRPTSPALLSTILWCMAHTANISSFHIPGSRDRIISKLFSLSLCFLRQRDMDSWHRVPGGWRFEPDFMSTMADGFDSNMLWTTYTKKPEPAVDDVITLTLLTTVISGGEFKSDSIRWLDKTVRLVKYLGYHSEATICKDSTEVPAHAASLQTVIEREERRRAFWLVYMLDRHLSLSFNRPLQLLDSECQVLNPLPEHAWQNIDMISLENLPAQNYGPPNTISGTGIFDFFLPLMAVLGDIIDLRLRRNHPRLGVIDDTAYLNAIKKNIRDLESSLDNFALLPVTPSPGTHNIVFDDGSSTLFSPAQGSSEFNNSIQFGTRSEHISTETRTSLVLAYARYIVHVLHVLLHGEWDAISMLEDAGDWIASSSFSECAFQAIAAAQAISEILEIDPELAFMPYLFGIYLFHGSFVLLLFADRMPQVGPNPSVEQACEVIIRAHEVCVVTLSTAFQRNFRKALRSTLNSVRFPGSATVESEKLRKEVLSMYRWTKGGAGLCL